MWTSTPMRWNTSMTRPSVSRCERMEPSWLWMSWFQQRCPWVLSIPQGMFLQWPQPHKRFWYKRSRASDKRLAGTGSHQAVEMWQIAITHQSRSANWWDFEDLEMILWGSKDGRHMPHTLRWFWWWNFGGWILNWNSLVQLPCPMAARNLCWKAEWSQ